MNCSILKMVFGSALVLGMGVRPTAAQHNHAEHGAAGHEQQAAVAKCPVMDEPASLALSVATDDGPVFFCCKGCIPKYQKSPGKYAAKAAAQRKVLADRAKVQVTCPVSKEAIDKKIFVESKGKKVYFCCKGCGAKYEADPAKYAGALANSYSYQTTCPVMGGKINPKVSTKLSTGETIYYCCPGCDKPLRDNPSKYNKNLVAQGILVDWAEVKKADSGEHDGHDHGSHGHEGHDHGG